MPGVSLRYDFSNTSTKIKNDNDRVLEALDSTVYNTNYKQEILLKDQHLLLACCRYPEYPIKIFDASEGNFWICIEGKIYGKEDSVIKNELDDLLTRIFTTDSPNTTVAKKNNDKLINWLLKTDGEFIIYALNKKTKGIAIMNDILGRLPLYYHYSIKLGLIISRELQFISFLTEGANGSKFDRMAIAQYLLFGYPLGERILQADVFRVKPASLIRIHNNNKLNEKQFRIVHNNNKSKEEQFRIVHNNNKSKEEKFSIDTLYSFNFDIRYTDHDIKRDATELVSLFSEACKNRAFLDSENKKKNIISLSGGLDSRCVTAAFDNKKLPCSAATHISSGWTPVTGNDSEEHIAEKLANMFGFEWEKYGPFQLKAKNLLNLLTIKQGAAYLGYSFYLSFLEQMRERHDGLDVTFFTGEGRETVLPSYIHSKKYKDIDDLVSHIINRRSNFPLSDIAAITQIKQNEIIDEIKNIISSYPEKSLNQKYVHFLVNEIAFKSIYEIEDLNRYYFWSVSPFYSVPFFEYAVGCYSSSKPYEALYRKFLYLLSPSAASIDKADYGAPITSYKYRTMFFILTIFYKYPNIKKIARNFIRKKNRHYDCNSTVIRCLQDQIQNCKFISRYLSCHELGNIVNKSAKYNRRAIDILFTITSLIEKTHGNESSIIKCCK